MVYLAVSAITFVAGSRNPLSKKTEKEQDMTVAFEVIC